MEVWFRDSYNTVRINRLAHQTAFHIMINWTKYIGVIGLTQSGKTTFLTSLLDHWSNHQPRKFPLGKDPNRHDLMIQWRGDDAQSGKHRFEKNRAELANGQWVEKSLASESYALNLSCKSWRFSQPVRLFDIPGERLADAEMLSYKCLSSWSAKIVHSISVDPSLEIHAREFLQIFREASEPNQDYLHRLEKSYRQLMARFASRRIPLITPSSLLVDADGKYVPDEFMKSPEKLEAWFTDASPMGVRGKPVVPVPNTVKQKGGKIWDRCQRNYDEYRRLVVQPALKPLGACHDIVFLVDIAGIFSQGTSWKNQTSTLIESFVSGVAPQHFMKRRLNDIMHFGAMGFISPQVNRIVFVAAQADRIHRDDRFKVKQLLEDLARPAIKFLAAKRLLDVHYRVVAAIESTECLEGHELRYFDARNSEHCKMTVSELPDSFPDSWTSGDYRFPMTAPRIPANKGNPPKQFGLEGVTELLFNIQ